MALCNRIANLMHLIKHPNKLLTQVSKDADSRDPKVWLLSAKMHFWMREWNGLGLSAVQVGHPKRIITIDTRHVDEMHGKKLTMYNPVVTKLGDVMFKWNEGCLSFPGQFVENDRPSKVTVLYMTNEGPMEETLYNITAFCFLHEYDHLEGHTMERLLK